MSNNQLCNLLGGFGCTITAACLFLMLCGATNAAWGAAAAILLALITLFNYD